LGRISSEISAQYMWDSRRKDQAGTRQNLRSGGLMLYEMCAFTRLPTHDTDATRGVDGPTSSVLIR